MAKKHNNLAFRLISVTESQFNLDLRNLKLEDLQSGDNLIVGLGGGVSGNIEENKIVFTLNARYTTCDDVSIMNCSYDFVFEVESLSEYITLDEASGQFTAKDILTNNILSVATGTIRGVIVVKTAGTILSSFPLPIIDVYEVSASIFGNSSNVTIEQTKQ